MFVCWVASKVHNLWIVYKHLLIVFGPLKVKVNFFSYTRWEIEEKKRKKERRKRKLLMCFNAQMKMSDVDML